MPKSNHCGSCHPCIVRRISLISAGMDKFDTDYIIDIFNHLFPRYSSRKEFRDAAISVLELLKFSKDIIHLEPEDVRYEYPEFEEITDDFPVEEAIDIYKRFSLDVMKAFEKNASKPMKDVIGEYLV